MVDSLPLLNEAKNTSNERSSLFCNAVSDEVKKSFIALTPGRCKPSSGSEISRVNCATVKLDRFAIENKFYID